MCAKTIRNAVLLVCVIAVGSAISFAQATFTAGSTPATAADIGYAEPAGSVTLEIVSGTSVAAPLFIVYSAPITNNDVSEISLSATGNLNGSSVVLDRANNSILVNVLAGGTAGDRIKVSGVRLAVVGLNASQVMASITIPSSGGNSILAGQTNLAVIGKILQPFTMDTNGASPLSYVNGTATQSSSSFKLVEKYAEAFSGSGAGVGRIRITPFPSIADGVRITLGATAVSGETGALFRTLSGNPETVPREDGSTEVVYEYVPAAGSPTISESFTFNATMAVDTPGSGSIQFQAALIPIGLAIPTDEFPSTALPRYAERMVPDEIDLVTGSTELLFPFRMQREDTYTGVALTNPLNYRVRATLTAYDADGKLLEGSNITNPVTIELPRKGQYAKLASQIFGENFNASSHGTIRVVGQTSSLNGFYLIGNNSGPQLDGAVGNTTGTLSWYLPAVFRQGLRPFNSLEFYNPGDSDSTLTLQLVDMNGNVVAAREIKSIAGSTSSADITELFSVDLNQFEGGYIKASSDLPVIVRDTFGNAREGNVLVSQVPLSLTSFSIPHFASGAQYSTELSIVNTNKYSVADVTLKLLDDNSEQLAEPVNVQINPGAQMMRTVADLFPNLGSGLVTGSIRVEVKPSHEGPFQSVPGLVGSVRFANTDGSASAALPLVITRSNEFVYSHVAQSQGWFTGLAVLNPNSTVADVTVEVYQNDGVRTGIYSTQLQPGQRFSKLVEQIIPESKGQSGGYLKVTSNLYLTSFSLFGSTDLLSLSAIPPQAVR